MCVASSGKDFSSEFLHQTLAKTFSIWLLCKFRRNQVVIFSLQHESKKLSLQKSLKEQGLHGEVTLYYVYTQVDLLAAWKYLLGKSLSWSSRKTCWWRRNCIGRNYPNERNQTIDSLLWVQPESGECHFTRQLAKLDFWPWFQPEPGERHFARPFAKLDFRPSFQPEPG